MSHPESQATSGESRSIDLTTESGVLRSRLAVAEAAFFAIVERSSDGILVVDGRGVVLFANAAALTLLGRSRADLVGSDVGFAVVVGNVAEVELVRPDAELAFAEMRVVDTVWEGKPCLLALLRDVTDRHQVEAELAQRATHDHLTGLPNRFLLEDRLEHALDRLGRERGSLALFVVDLDDFKAVNDRWGHAAGDAVLVEAAQRIRSVLRPVDTVARFGGDEFVMVCESMDRGAAEVLCGRLTEAFRRPLLVRGGSTVIGLSVGFVVVVEGGASVEVLLAAADAQMYGHKRRSRAASGEAAGTPSEAGGDAATSSSTRYRFTLYVAGVGDRSATAEASVGRFCEQNLPTGSYTVRVVDVLRAEGEADAVRVLVTPTLVRSVPLPVVRVVGDLSDVDVLVAALGLGRPDG
ncbi:MAG: diguanylate cyclase [Frankiales bacterium]|nr:MAG: diguanylate cyclase [Frankiales bacterium]